MGLSMDKFRSILESPGTDLYARNYIGETALHTCVQNGNRNLVEEMMTVLLDSDEGNLAQIATYGGKTALDFALERGREESIELLVQPKRKATVGVEGNPDSTWITRWSDETWYSHLVRILHSCQPTIAAETKRLEAKWGTPLIGWNSRSNDSAVNLRNRETYCGSRTWFEAGIERGSHGETVCHRRIQDNINTSNVLRQHTIIWDVDDQSPGLSNWLKGIQGGDTIHVFPKACRRGWVNYVEDVTVTVFYQRH
ncbi:hypothetical protein MW887_011443 [Aspergillus wentii]|nr:hypothetical protein MW887_011443 [Aspergillus wentii]